MSWIWIVPWVSYPVLIYLALRWWEPRAVAGVALGLLGLRLAWTRRGRGLAMGRALGLPVLCAGAPLAAAALWNHESALLVAPAFASLFLLAGFGLSLLRPPSQVERFARLWVDELSPAEIAYCRRVTGVWCGFFALNAAAIALLALHASRELWALYTGLLSYAAIGGLFAVEYVYRHWRFRRYLGAPTDALLRRLFPPPPVRPG